MPAAATRTMATSAASSESDPLLPQRATPRPSKSWLAPMALLASLARGFSVASRTQLITKLTCQHKHRHIGLLSHEDTLSTLKLSLDDCFKDPEIQANAAHVQIAFTVIVGVLVSLTAGRWGRWSAQYGRISAMIAALAGLSLAELCYGLLALPSLRISRKMPWLLLLAPVFEGLFGGWFSLQASMNSYISDASTSHSCAKSFAGFTGLTYLGFALGPSLASLMLRHMPSTSDAMVFFVASIGYSMGLAYMKLVVPESAPPQKTRQPSTSSTGTPSRPPRSTVWRTLLSPLAAFRPRRAGALRKDYGLTVIASAYFLYLLTLGIYQFKYLYAEHVYGWDAEMLGYYITAMGIIRAATLLVFLPGLLWIMNPLISVANRTRKELIYDLRVTRISILVDCLSHVLVAASDLTPKGFFVFTSLTSFGASAVPSLQSAVLGYVRLRIQQADLEENDTEEDVGQLFGGLAVLQSMSQTVLGPILFGTMYANTVRWYPKGIFIGGAALCGLAFLLMFSVRPRKRMILVGTRHSPGHRVRGRSGTIKGLAGR